MMPARAIPSSDPVSVSPPLALTACAGMAVFYVAILHAPTVLLRLPPPTSLDNYMIRRFACAVASSAASVALTVFLVGIGRFRDMSSLLGLFGIRGDHLLRATVLPLLLTSLVYGGSLVSRLLAVISYWRRVGSSCCCRRFGEWACDLVHNVMAWRNYVVHI